MSLCLVGQRHLARSVGLPGQVDSRDRARRKPGEGEGSGERREPTLCSLSQTLPGQMSQVPVRGTERVIRREDG